MNKLRIANLSCLGDGGVEASLQRAIAMIEEACADRADLVCLPETFAWTHLAGEERLAAAQSIDGPFCSSMAKVAADRQVNILCALLERNGDRVYNTMVWFDRTGKVIGVYRKAFPTDYEMAEGVSPGPLGFEAFQTEFGPVGCVICFDLNFREAIESLARQGCKLVIVPTMFDGLELMKAWAKLYGMYFMTVAAYPYGAVVDPLGKTVVEPWQHGNTFVMDIDLDFEVLHTDGNLARFPCVRAALGAQVEIESRDISSSALLVSRHPEKTAAAIAAEFELEVCASYLSRSAALAAERR